MRDILTALEADDEIGNLEEEEVAITEEIAGVLERRQKDKLPALRDIPKKKFINFLETLRKHANFHYKNFSKVVTSNMRRCLLCY